MRPAFTRGFRLHYDGRIYDGAEFPSGRVYVVDDPEYGLATAATSMDHLLKGYYGARVEWPGDQLVPTALLLDLVDIAAQVAGTTGHTYLSTGCLHGDTRLPDGRTGHEYCQSETGKAGAKTPAQCKVCAAPCLCFCHADPADTSPNEGADRRAVAHAVLGRLTTYLGYDVAERAAEQQANRALARGETHL
ncbi:hypothetical protein [Streptomyces sp. 3214.6]|uniref:hypothetical protein n=1 Tax=Streptomyces sp. 3214.6 TaxID=1882757 RepID=UPI00090C2839|nr:hypothetical protein [Streptomyces sp. 3214.6]SHI66434.1 hypothetical protein SAMN05444521_8175 [Streptomyces sp. 3214.6]